MVKAEDVGWTVTAFSNEVAFLVYSDSCEMH